MKHSGLAYSASNAVRTSDPESERVVRQVESRGEDSLNDLDRWRLQGIRDRQRRQAARTAHRVDEFTGIHQRLAVIEATVQPFAKGYFPPAVNEALGEVIAETAHEAEQRATAEAKKLLAELGVEFAEKSNAQFSAFETVVAQLRDEDRRTLFENLRETLADAESRIDTGVQKAAEGVWQRAELECALLRDELMAIISEQKFGQFNDDGPRLELAERAIATLRKRMAELEGQSAKHGEVIDQLGQVREGLDTFEAEHRKVVKSLTLRCAANVVAAQQERKRGDELASKVAYLEAEFDRLVQVLVAAKVIT